LAKAGVTEVILAVNYQPEIMMAAIKDFEKEYNLKISFSLEDEPLGTAGPIRLAEKIIREQNESGLFFVFNSDVICEYPLDKLVEFHKSHGKQGTIVVTKVEDPSKYGVVIAKPDGEIEKFVEKPQHFVSDKINAGLYLFSMDMIQRIPQRPCSIEREIFPQMAAEQHLYQMELPGYWMDIGQPKDYLSGQKMFIKSEKEKGSNLVIGNDVIIHPSAKVEEGAELGPSVVIGANCHIAAGVKISNSTIFAGTKVHSHSYIDGSIIGWKNTVGKWARVTGLTCTGEDV
jgi:mannose-1-phosphate guanylyltransferase